MDGEQAMPLETLPAIIWGFEEVWARSPAVLILLGVSLLTTLIELLGFILALWPSEARVNAYGPPPGRSDQAEAFA
jgi:hypothetical protein